MMKFMKKEIPLITTEYQKADKNKTAGQMTLFTLSYLYVCLLGVSYAFIDIGISGLRMEYNKLPVIITLVLSNLLFSGISQLTKKRYFVIFILCIYTAFFFILHHELILGLQIIHQNLADLILHLYSIHIPAPGLTYMSISTLTLTLIFLSVPISALYHLFIHRYRTTWGIFISTFLELLLILQLSYAPGTVSLFIFFISSILLYVYCLITKSSRTVDAKLRGSVLKLVSSCAAFAVVCALILSSFLSINPDTISAVKGEILRFYKENNLYKYNNYTTVDTASGGLSDGNLSNADRLDFSDALHLEIILEEKPEAPIYLNGFVSDTYEQERWVPQDELPDGSDTYTAEDNCWSITMAFASSGHYTSNITIRNHTSWNEFLPYGSHYWADPSTIDTHVYSYYPDFYQYLKEDKEKLQTKLSSINDFGTFYEEYLMQCLLLPEHFNSFYTFIDENELYPEEQVLDSADKVASVLREEAIYTLSPGAVPEEQDFIEYFLTENKQGFCMHFASSAVMIFRSMGIPSRYAEGYIAMPYDFHKQDDGTYKASLKDSRAHAWAEIFIDNLGWIPIETTPSYTENEVPHEPDNVPSETMEPPNTTTPTEPAPKNLPLDNKTGTAINIILPSITPPQYLMLLLLFFSSVIIFIILRKTIICRKKKKILEGKDYNAAVLLIYHDTESLVRFFKCPPEAFISKRTKIEKTAEKIAFSPHPSTSGEKLEAYKCYISIYRNLAKSAGMRQKLYLWYIKCLLT